MQDPGPSFQQHFDFSSPSAFNHHFAHCGDNTIAPTDTSSSPSSSFQLSSQDGCAMDGIYVKPESSYPSFDDSTATISGQLSQHNPFQALTSSPSHMEGGISPASSSTSPIRPRFDMSGNVNDIHASAFSSSGIPASQMGHGSWSSTPATSATDAGGSPNSCANGQSSGSQGADGSNSQTVSGKKPEDSSSSPLPQKESLPAKTSDAADAAAADKKLQSKFVYKVYSMCEDADCQHLITWSENGKSVSIHNFEEFSKDVLGKHFKHQNFSSFIRQLNMYGFYKVNKSNKSSKGSTEAAVWEFSHPKFQRGRLDLLDGIKRKVFEAEQTPESRAGRPSIGGERSSFSMGDQDSYAGSSVGTGRSVTGSVVGPSPTPTVYSGVLASQVSADISNPSQLIASHRALRMQVDSLQHTLAQMAHYTRQLGDTLAHVIDHARRMSAANSADGLPTFDIQIPVANFAMPGFSHPHPGMPGFSPLQPVFTSPTPTFTSGQHPSNQEHRQRFDSRPEIYVTEPPLGLGHPHPSESSGWSSTTPTGPSGAYMTRDARRSNSTPGPGVGGSGFIRPKVEMGTGMSGSPPNPLTIDTQYANFGSGRVNHQQEYPMAARPGGVQQRSASMYSTLQSGSSQMVMAADTPLPPSPSVNDFTATGLPAYGSNSAAGSLYGTSPESFDSSMRIGSSGGGGGAGTPSFLTTTSPFMASFPGGVSSDLAPGSVSDFGVLSPNSNGGSSYGGSSRGSRSPGRGSISRGASASSQERPAPYPQQHSVGKAPTSPGGGVKRKSPGV